MNQFSLPAGTLDSCTLGTLTCGAADCHPGGILTKEEETVSLFAVASRNSRHQDALRRYSSFAKSRDEGDSPEYNDDEDNDENENGREPFNSLEALKQRVGKFHSKGWLSQHEHRKYMALLDTAPTPKGNGSTLTEPVQLELAKELDMLEARMNGRGSTTVASSSKQPYSVGRTVGTDSKVKTAQTIPSARSGVSEVASSTSSAKPGPPLSVITSHVNNRLNKSITNAKAIASQLSQAQIEEMFVETCFFARLGFLQPPCCLYCTYQQQSMKHQAKKPNSGTSKDNNNNNNNNKCQRWIVWRRDAKQILHPNNLRENVMVVQCHAANKLLQRTLVDSHKWDNVTKQLMHLTARPSYKTF